MRDMEPYCTKCQIFMAFERSDVGVFFFLMSGVLRKSETY